MDKQSEDVNENAEITSYQSEQDPRDGEADVGENKKESSSGMSSVKRDDCSGETSTKQEIKDSIKSQNGELSNNSERRPVDTPSSYPGSLLLSSLPARTKCLACKFVDTQVTYIEPTDYGRYPNCEFSDWNVLGDQSSKRIVEQAMEILKLVEKKQEEGQYDEALSCCQTALQLLDFSHDINLHTKFYCNIMQLYIFMENIEAALNTYYDHCVDVLEYVSDPKVIQSIMDLHTLCLKKLKRMTVETSAQGIAVVNKPEN